MAEDNIEWKCNLSELVSRTKLQTPTSNTTNPLSALVYSQPKSNSEINTSGSIPNYLVKR